MESKFKDYISQLQVGDEEVKFFDLKKFGDKFSKLPYSVRVLLESAIRNCDDFQVNIFLSPRIFSHRFVLVVLVVSTGGCCELWHQSCVNKWFWSIFRLANGLPSNRVNANFFSMSFVPLS